MSHVVAVCLSPTLQKTIFFDSLEKDRVNRSTGYRLDASGKAVNAARVLNQLEPGTATAVVPLGAENAELFLGLAATDSLPISWVSVPGLVRYCYTLLEPERGGATELVVNEASSDADYGAVAKALLAAIDSALSGADALLLAGSRPPFWPDDLLLAIRLRARAAGCPVLVDFQGKDLSLVLERDPPEIVKINEAEFCATFGLPFPLEEERLSREISERSAAFGVILAITRGMKDTIAADRGVLYREPAEAVKALNTIGCGDSFSAGFLHSWLGDRDTRKALAQGRRCATLNAANARPGSIV